MKNAIILCSGGLDSVTTAHLAKKKLGYKNIIILFFDYGQRSLKIERKLSKTCARDIGAVFEEVKLDWLEKISGSLINKKQGLSKREYVLNPSLKNTQKESKKFYVPCRNTLFISYALALAESLYIKNKKIYDIVLGFKCEGKDSYPDTTPEFLKEMNRLSKISCSKSFSIIAPLIKMDKEDIVMLGKSLGVNFKKTFSCYTNNKIHCGKCLACRLRKAGFYWANIKDPTRYIGF